MVRECVFFAAFAATGWAHGPGGHGEASANELEFRATGGGQIDSDPHGTVDLGVRRGALSAQLFTDTLDLRFAPESAGGRFFVAARGEALAAGLLASPWTAGAPDPSRSLWASYAGLEGGFVRYLPNGFWAGAQASARAYWFEARAETRVPVPSPTSLVTGEVIAGSFSPDLAAWIRAGVDVEGLSPSPHVAVEATYRPSATVAPRLEVRAAWAKNQSDLTRTRLGGLNPYVVPLAGAAWAEWRVESYVAARAGITWSTRWTEVGALCDVAAFDDTIVSGFALTARARVRRFFVENALGVAPWITRQAGVSRVSAWFLVGTEWGAFRSR